MPTAARPGTAGVHRGDAAHRHAKWTSRIASDGRRPSADADDAGDRRLAGARMGRMATETKRAVAGAAQTGAAQAEAPKRAPAMPVLNVENLKTSIEEIKAMGGAPPWNKILVRK